MGFIIGIFERSLFVSLLRTHSAQPQLATVTVIIAARPEQADIQAVPASRALDYPTGKLEIIVARGKQPSAQRNAAIKAARGEWIYFLDDDSVPRPDNLRRVAGYFGD